jgi:hypothetical protein
MPVEQPRRKRDNDGALNRRLNIPQKSHQANTLFRDAFGGAKVGKLFKVLTKMKAFENNFEKTVKNFILFFQ